MLSEEDKDFLVKKTIRTMKKYGCSLKEMIDLYRESADYLESLGERAGIDLMATYVYVLTVEYNGALNNYRKIGVFLNPEDAGRYAMGMEGLHSWRIEIKNSTDVTF